MFLCKVKLRSSLHHIIFALLVLVESSFTTTLNGSVTANPIVPRNALGENGDVSSKATVGTSIKAALSETPMLPPAELTTSSTSPNFTPTKTSHDVKNSSAAFSFTKQTVPTDHPPLPPTTFSEPPALTPSSSSVPTVSGEARTNASALNATTAKPVENANQTNTQVTSESTMTTASTAGTTPVLHRNTTKPVYETKTTTTPVIKTTMATTSKTTPARTTGSDATTTKSTPSPSSPSSSSSGTPPPIPSTRLPLSSASPLIILPSTRTISSTTTLETTTGHKKLAPLETTAAMVEVLGGALSRQLASTAFLLAVLVCGSLLFVITVLVFVKQAYESYTRKDYSQVDYLINGMYSDSSV